MPGVELLQGTRFPSNPDVSVYGLRLEYTDVIQVRWPDGTVGIMERCMRVAGTYDTGADHGKRPDFWIRAAYQDYDIMVREVGKSRDRHGDGAGDPFPIPDVGELGPDGGLDPEEWTHG
jgi:hypothetical protein